MKDREPTRHQKTEYVIAPLKVNLLFKYQWLARPKRQSMASDTPENSYIDKFVEILFSLFIVYHNLLVHILKI